SLEFLDEGIEGAEIVAIVRITHDHEFSMGCFDPSLQRIAIAALRGGHNLRAKRFRNFNGSIGAAVVGYDDLAQKILSREISSCFRNTRAECRCLIEARQQDGKRDFFFNWHRLRERCTLIRMFSGGRTSARSHSRKPENNTRIPKKLEVQVDCGLQPPAA